MDTTRELAVLVALVSRRLRAKFKDHLPKDGITPVEWLALLWMSEGGGTVSQRQLGEKLDLSGGPLTRLVKSLVTQGLVEQLMDPLDKRSRRLRLAPAAQGPIKVAEALGDRFRAKVFAAIPPGELEISIRVMRILAQRLE